MALVPGKIAGQKENSSNARIHKTRASWLLDDEAPIFGSIPAANKYLSSYL